MDPCGTYSRGYGQEIAVIRTRLQWGLTIVLIIFLFVIPPRFLGSHVLSVINILCITLISVCGLNVLTGYCGQISLGQAGFMALGGYTAAILVSKVGMPFIFALLCAGLAAALIGIIIGIPSLRVKGFYLAVVTLAAFIVIDFVVRHLTITGGHSGMILKPATVGNIVLDTPQKKYLLIILLTVVITIFTKNMMRTKLGRAFMAIRDNDLAAQVMGISVFYHKLLAFAICSFYAGIAGALLVFNGQSISPDYFQLMHNIMYVGMLVVGGMGTAFGPILGTVLFVGLDELSTYIAPTLVDSLPALHRYTGLCASLGPILMGTVIILFMLFEPRGLEHRWEKIKAFYRLWPFSY